MKRDISEHLNPLKSSSNSLVAKVRIPPVSKTIGPGKSFYDYINQKWLQTTRVPKHLSKYSAEMEVNEYLDTFLYKIIVDSVNNSDGIHAPVKRLIQGLTFSIIRPEVQHFNTATLKSAIRSLACIQTVEQVGEMLGKMMRNGIPNILSIGLEINQPTGRYVVTISPGQLCLGNPQHYYMNNEIFKAKKTKVEYLSLLALFTKDFDLTQDLAKSYEIEHHIAHIYVNLEPVENMDFVSLNMLEDTYKLIPWAEIFKGLNFKPERHAKFIIYNTQWLKIVNNLLKEIPISGWISLLSANILVQGLFTLPEPYKTRVFNFFIRNLNGSNLSQPPPQFRTLEIIKKIIPTELTYLFVKNFLTPSGKKNAEEFTHRILDAAVKRIEMVSWMETTGKKKVIQKIRAIKTSIYYPESKGPPKSHGLMSNDCLLDNIYKLSAENTDEALQLVGKAPIEALDWVNPPYIVNAYYLPTRNIICVPAASFFFPLYDPKRIGWNYGGIGAFIGHEITHAFDKQGQNFNEKGEQKPIWSSHDKQGYTKRMNEIIKLYSKETVHSVHLKGDKTVSENLADLGALQIALCALETHLEGIGASKERRLEEIREFFISYATSWRTTVHTGEALVRIYTDPHSPAKQRVNLVIAQTDQWYEAFNIVSSDSMYVKPEDRIVIF